MAIIDELIDLKSATLNSIAQAADTSELEAVRVSVLGKKGTLTAYLRGMGAARARRSRHGGQDRQRGAQRR